MASLLAMRGITKTFPGVRALSDVSIDLGHGEVLGIVGENGAGKSTLMKILAGVYRPEHGSIEIDGQVFAPRGPRDSLDHGVTVIYQELSLVPDRSIAENVFLGNLPRAAFGRVDRRKLEKDTAAILARVGLSLSPRTLVRQLGIAQQQLVEIARALSRRARIIVMDEPSATLTESELRILMRTIAALKASGVGLIYISHHLEEVFEVCDRVMVMRDGSSIEARKTADWTHDDLVQAMVNRPITSFFPKQDIAIGPPLLEVSGLEVPDRISGVSFTLHAGEILGIGGLVGAGRTEVLKALYGALRTTAGDVRLSGKKLRLRKPRDAIRAGFALVPEDRKGEGLILPFSLRQNVALSTLPRLAWLGVLSSARKINELARKAVADLRIRTPGIRQAVRNLSGGNQQKVVLARAMSTRPRVFLLDEPTRGIDIGAKVEVYALIGKLAAEGAGILVVSSELLELLGVCDRILVMRAGRLAGEVLRRDFSQERIMALSTLG
jgi:ABC-type sugar transport system ATPase subunit